VNHQPVFEGDLQTVSEEGDEQVRIGPVFELMIDGADP
jgi:hypothetical protein